MSPYYPPEKFPTGKVMNWFAGQTTHISFQCTCKNIWGVNNKGGTSQKWLLYLHLSLEVLNKLSNSNYCALWLISPRFARFLGRGSKLFPSYWHILIETCKSKLFSSACLKTDLYSLSTDNAHTVYGAVRPCIEISSKGWTEMVWNMSG